MKSDQQNAIVDEALSWVGTPYHHMAHVKGAGCDCATFLAEVYRRTGIISDLKIEPYPEHWHLHQSRERYLEIVLKYCDPVETPQPGDIAMYRLGRTVSHGAIVIDWPQIIHCDRKKVKKDYALTPMFTKRFYGFFTVREN